MDIEEVCRLIYLQMLECDGEWIATLYNQLYELEYGHILRYTGDGLFEFKK